MPRAPAPESQQYVFAICCILMLRRRFVADADVTDCAVATADGDRKAIGKNLVDKHGDRL